MMSTVKEIQEAIPSLPRKEIEAVRDWIDNYLAKLKAEGKTPTSKVPLPDFFIAAHAQTERLKLATRDPRRARSYFPKVQLITP